jgi:two-component system sensor histidine kinase YesM
MLRFIRKRIQITSFFKKLFLYFLVLCIIPLLIISHTLYSQGKTTIQAASTDFIQLYVSQLNTTLNNYLLQIDYTSRSIFSDYGMIAYLQEESTYSTGEKIDNNLLISRQLIRFADQLPYVEGVLIISNEGKQYSTGNISALTDYQSLLEQGWFQDIVQAGGQLVITPYYVKTTLKEQQFDVFTAGRLIKDQQGVAAGVILFELSSASLITINNQLFELRDQYQAQILVHSKNGELLFEMNPEYEKSSVDVQINAQSSAPDSSILSITNRSPATGISVTVHVPTSSLYKQLDHYKNLSFLITLLVLVIIIPASIWISYQITKPIQRLFYNMKHVEEGFYHPILETNRSDELGTLTRHYNQMIAKIKHLIEDVLTAEIKHNEARFLALQNQINPHWLNNTLESIRMEAQLNNSPEVAKMIQTLGRLFQLGLNKSNRTNLIRDEIEYIQTYIALQNIRFDNRFHLYIELDEQLLDVHIPKMIFQPLIENSIVHGFLRHDRDYSIFIEGSCEDELCNISIRDNGEGMTEEKLVELQKHLYLRGVEAEESKSLGLRNIIERLQLHYGDGLIISMNSSLGEGTVISFSFPPIKLE